MIGDHEGFDAWNWQRDDVFWLEFGADHGEREWCAFFRFGDTHSGDHLGWLHFVNVLAHEVASCYCEDSGNSENFEAEACGWLPEFFCFEFVVVLNRANDPPDGYACN